ncbi:Aa_trans domain-containing protein [Cephalotus follicularis]|uniref:Aa_trans domain-containing protein n=1 Tax=Cephalotus follicularis TaxID=3775 RepID=A0A1Q3ANR1_CEPFO|nr:Aa_trans domain-containing protein [Cephalotus follicularis]
MDHETKIPLIESGSSPTGNSSTFQALGNILVSIVGTGVLGLPFAFRVAGWLAGSLGVIIAAISTYYCMLLLIQSRNKLALELESTEIITYGDLGHKSMGRAGRFLTEFLICISQCGGSVAYLVFIGQNLSSMLKGQSHTITSYIFMLVPVQIALSWIDSLSALAPFSIFANVCNVLAMVIVLKEDVQQAIMGEFSFNDRQAITSNIGDLPFALGTAVFCFEGFGMTLALEASMRKRSSFPKLLAQAFFGITFVYVLFAFLGYMAYGDQTKDIVTLNLPQNWSAIAVQIGLCLGLAFTFPIMVHPVHEIVVGKLKSSSWFRRLHYDNDGNLRRSIGNLVIYACRALMVAGLAIVASCVPGFGTFVSLVGSTVCALLSFVLPAIFHLSILGSSLHFWQRALDYFILSCGLLFGAYGTYNAIFGI